MKTLRSLSVLLVLAFWLSGVAQAAPGGQAAAGFLPVADQSLYAAEPSPLTLEQCGQCHPRHFTDLKTAGGRHQFDCRACHTVFHAYNPRKANYAEIMPDCAACHQAVHGDKFSRCLDCHGNPHAVLRAPEIARVESACNDCHATQSGQLAAQPSRHTELSCSTCHHTRHGLVPSCSECHQGHFPEQDFAGCTECHDVHQPLDIRLQEENDPATCAACHVEVVGKWQGTASKHGQVSCAGCHNRHGQVPQCRDCHATPPSHSSRMMEKFPHCLDCHIDVHDLPVKKK